MTQRVIPVFTFLMFAVVLSAQAAAQTVRSDRPVDSAQTNATDATSGEPAISVEEAIRRATGALDRLELQEDESKVRAAIEEVDRSIEAVRDADPAHPHLPFLLGRAYTMIGRPGDAIEQLRAFVESASGRNEWRAYALLGDLFVGEYPSLARANYAKAHALNSRESGVLFGLSMAAMKLGELEEAIRLGREALGAEGGRSIRYGSHLAMLLRSDGRLEKAMAQAEATIALARDEVEVRPGGVAPLLALDVQYKLLISILRDRLEDSDQGRSEDYLRVASLIRERARIAEALALHDALRVVTLGVARTAPDTPVLLLEQHAILLAEVGLTNEAVSAFRKLRNADAKNPAAAEWLGRLRPAPAESTPIGKPDNPGW